jgi:hypothetical protein
MPTNGVEQCGLLAQRMMPDGDGDGDGDGAR